MEEFGMFAVDSVSRRVRGYLIPWDELSRKSVTTEPIKFKRGSLKLPRSPHAAKLNKDHSQVHPLGNGAFFAEHDKGLYCEFDIDDTEDGDQWLADHGDHVQLSAEVRDLVREGEYGTATLTGASLVPAGAFASAGLFALAEVGEEEATEAASAATEEPEEPAEEEEEETVPEAQIPTGLPAPAPVVVVEKKKEPTRGEMFAAIEAVHRGNASMDTVQKVQQFMAMERSALFALSDVDYDGTDGVGAKMTRPAWIGEVLDGTTYAQKFAPLFGQQTLTALNMSGWKWGTKPEGATWAGNKAAISSNTPTITPVTEAATRWAGGHDIAREHIDFNTPGFFDAYNAAMRESFDRWLDITIVLTEALAGATDLEADDPAGLDIGAGLSAIIDGAASIVAAGLTPTSAVVSPELWKSIAKIPQSDVLGYLNAQMSITGTGSLDGFQVIPAGTGQLTAGHVLVIARGAADVYTLPGSPIRAEAQNIANGGIDVGFFGYGGFLIKNAAGIVDVSPFVA